MSDLPDAESPDASAQGAAHAATALRLRRAHGHLHTVIAMLDANRSCIDIAQQLQAVESAVKQAKRSLIQAHVEACLEAAAGPLPDGARGAIDEFKAITKYL